MKCPYGCQVTRTTLMGTSMGKATADLNRIYISLSKSGKTLFKFYQCPSCGRVFKQGQRIQTLASARKSAKEEIQQ